jgi:hypothetical protein
MGKDTFDPIERASHLMPVHFLSARKLAGAFDAFMSLEFLLNARDRRPSDANCCRGRSLMGLGGVISGPERRGA